MSKQKICYKDRLRFAFGAALALTALPLMFYHMMANVALAYGPERKTFTDQNPADYVTFNSITNNPSIGDERNFVRIREKGVGNYVDSIDIQPGKTYQVWTYVHNNASTVYNSKEHNYKGIAVQTKLKSVMPATIQKGASARIVNTVSAKNAVPNSVWDDVQLTASQKSVILNYVQGSARVASSNGAVNGRGLNNEELFGEGSLLGYESLNGLLPGCTQYSMTVVYEFVANYADFEVEKTVSKSGANSWANSYNAKEEDKVDFKITYKNTGTVTQNDVAIQDILPAGMSLVSGSVKITTPSDQVGKTLNDSVVANGVNIGTYVRGGSATLTFTAKIDKSKLVCGVSNLTNTAKAHTQNGTKSDTATVTVQKNCTTEEKEKCQVVGKTHLDKNDPNCNDKCTVKGKENLKQDDENCFEPCTVKGKENLKKDDPNCTDDKCQIKGKENLKKDDKNCVEPCPVKGKENLKKDDPNCNDPCPVKGKENLKANDPNCYEPCTIKSREQYSANDIRCVEPCEIEGKEDLAKDDPLCAQTPVELPKTGPAEAAMIIVAITAISGAIAYWFRSQGEVKKATAAASKKKLQK